MVMDSAFKILFVLIVREEDVEHADDVCYGSCRKAGVRVTLINKIVNWRRKKQTHKSNARMFDITHNSTLTSSLITSSINKVNYHHRPALSISQTYMHAHGHAHTQMNTIPLHLYCITHHNTSTHFFFLLLYPPWMRTSMSEKTRRCSVSSRPRAARLR